MRIQNLFQGTAFCALLVKVLFLTFFIFAFYGMACGAPIQVIASGDSLTCMYWSSLPVAFNNLGVSATIPDPNYSDPGSICTSRGGMNSSLYTGQSAAYPNESPINYSANVLAADPNAILFMLGINDMGWGDDVDARFNSYKANLSPVFDDFANFTNSQGQHPEVVIGSILPFDVAKNEAYWYPMVHEYNVFDKIVEWNTWLQQQAAQHGFVYLDNFSAIQQVPDWTTTLLGDDGLHFTIQGEQWVASQFANATLVPEPSTIALLSISAFGLLTWAWQRKHRLV